MMRMQTYINDDSYSNLQRKLREMLLLMMMMMMYNIIGLVVYIP